MEHWHGEIQFRHPTDFCPVFITVIAAFVHRKSTDICLGQVIWICFTLATTEAFFISTQDTVLFFPLCEWCFSGHRSVPEQEEYSTAESQTGSLTKDVDAMWAHIAKNCGGAFPQCILAFPKSNTEELENAEPAFRLRLPRRMQNSHRHHGQHFHSPLFGSVGLGSLAPTFFFESLCRSSSKVSKMRYHRAKQEICGFWTGVWKI